MPNNSLIKVNGSIITKIKKFFKNFFRQQDIKNYEIENTENIVENQQEVKNSIFAQNIKVEETENQKLLRLQRLIREKRISETDLSEEEKNKLKKLYNSQIGDLRKSILQKRNKIMKIKYEQKRKSHASV